MITPVVRRFYCKIYCKIFDFLARAVRLIYFTFTKNFDCFKKLLIDFINSIGINQKPFRPIEVKSIEPKP